MSKFVVVIPSVAFPTDPIRFFSSEDNFHQYIRANGGMLTEFQMNRIDPKRIYKFNNKDEAIEFFNNAVNNQFFELNKIMNDLKVHYNNINFDYLEE